MRVGDVRRRAAMGVRGAARGGREGPMEFRDGRGERGRFRRGGGGSDVASPRAVRRGVSPAPERRGFEPDVGRVRCEDENVSLLAPLACGFVARVGREGRDAQIRRDVFSRSAAQGGTRVVVPRDAAAEARERASDARFDHAAAAACAAEDDDMDVRAKNERVPTTLAELRNHPLYVVERFLPPTRACTRENPWRDSSRGSACGPVRWFAS